MNMFDFPFSALQSFRDTRLAQFAKDVFDKASEPAIAEELAASHNVSAADIATVNTLLTQYNTVMAAPRQHIGEKSAYAKQVARDVRSVNDIIKRIALKMATYRATNRILFDAFEAVNSIDDTGAHHNTSTNGTVNAAETKLVTTITYDAAAAITIKNTGSTALDFILYNNGTPGGSITVAGGTTTNTTLGAIGTGGNALYVKNNGTATGNYTVRL